MSRTKIEIDSMLDEKIPRSVVSERDGGGGRKLSYLEGWYVIDRLNRIFGPTGWSKNILEIREVVNKTPRGEFPAYLVKLALTIHNEGYPIVKEAYGYGSDKSPQNAHELAIKEAVTDALKVAAKDLGMSLGLALYDKTQEFVDDEEIVQNNGTAPDTKSVSKTIVAEAQPPNLPTLADDKKRELIRSYFSAAVKKGVTTLPEMQQYLQGEFSVQKLDDAPKESLDMILAYVKGL